MKKDVIITICGLQVGPDVEGEPVEMIVRGEYFYKNKKHYLLYEEAVEGEPVTNKNRIKCMPGYMELKKTGSVSVHMVFEEEKTNVTQYYTPYGNLLLGICTKHVTVKETTDFIEIKVTYALEMNQEHTADCNIRITVRETDNKQSVLI